MKLKAGTEFQFTVKNETPIITILRPRSSEGQFIQEDKILITPFAQVTEYSDSYGNGCQRLVLEKGTVHIATEVIAEVEDNIDKDFEAPFILVEELPFEILQYLLPSRYCPSDLLEIGQLAQKIAKNISIGYQQVEAFRLWINRNIKYEYGFSNLNSSALDTLTGRAGVCRDFSHLAISLCRSMNIPARMVVGYFKDLKYMDLHAWFQAYIGNKWYTFDAVQPITTAGRIVMAYGRDATDVALITQFGNAYMNTMRVWVEDVTE